MPDHTILIVSNVERSLAFFGAALKPLDIKFFLAYKGKGDHPDLWGFGDGKRAFFWIKEGKPDPAASRRRQAFYTSVATWFRRGRL